MRQSMRLFTGLLAGSMLLFLPQFRASAQSTSDDDKADAAVAPSQDKSDKDVPEYDLLDAMRQNLVSVKAEGTGDGRMTMSITNRTRRQLRVILPPGIIAQGATGQFGGMGGMGGGMGGGMMGGMGGGMGGMGGGMGGMGGGMGGMGGMGGGMGGMGGMGRMSGTMPPMMGMMMLARMIMYFCGDPDSWDMRSLMMGMGGMGMGGMGMGGMGGMGGGMGGMGGMGGGMRSVPATKLPSADLKPNQTRHLPTRLVSISKPDPELGVSLPEKGEQLRIMGDVSDVVSNPRVQKALKRLAADKAPATISQMVMWRLGSGLDWELIAQLSERWANRYEMTLARDFVDRLDVLPEGETGRLLFSVEATDPEREPQAAEIAKAIDSKPVLGLVAQIGVPVRPQGPAVACRIRLTATDALVVVSSTDATAANWVPFGKFTLRLAKDKAKLDVAKFNDSLAEGILNRLVRAQLIKDSGTKTKNKLVYQLRIENASPLVLNGIALLGTNSKPDQLPQILSGICLPPRKKMTYPATDDLVKSLGLKKGTKVVALDLSGL